MMWRRKLQARWIYSAKLCSRTLLKIRSTANLLWTIKQGAVIEFTVKGSNDLYLDLNNSHLHVLAKITKVDWTKIDANTASLINLSLYSKFREITVNWNCRNVGHTSQPYPYCLIIKSLLNYCKEIQETRLLCEGWTKYITGHMAITAVLGTLQVWTLEPRLSREVPWSSSSVALTWTFFTIIASFLQTSIST